MLINWSESIPLSYYIDQFVNKYYVYYIKEPYPWLFLLYTWLNWKKCDFVTCAFTPYHRHLFHIRKLGKEEEVTTICYVWNKCLCSKSIFCSKLSKSNLKNCIMSLNIYTMCCVSGCCTHIHSIFFSSQHVQWKITKLLKVS